MSRNRFLRTPSVVMIALLTLVLIVMPGERAYPEESSCIVCHTDPDLLRENRNQPEPAITRPASGADGETAAVSPESLENILVAEDFFDTVHAEFACVDCHGGDDGAPDKESAHAGLDAAPSANRPQETCGECHEEIAETAPQSLHATLATFPGFLAERAGSDSWPAVDKTREQQCASCHASCGSCHVSRPRPAGGGFINGHLFSARPDPVRQCGGCHDRTIGDEFFGSRGQGDVHLRTYTMTCSACHGAGEMHAAAPDDLKNRYHLAEAAHCTDCHRDLQYGSVREHRIHNNRVQCQVCHSQAYLNCYGCHTGGDADDPTTPPLAGMTEGLKIGFNPDRLPGNNYEFVLLRHVPVAPDTFDHSVKNGLPRFDVAPTWKRTSPHNIQRRTWQNATCNNCHGQRDLFLAESDLLDYEKKANFGLTVKDDQIPRTRTRTMGIDLDISQIKGGLVVDAAWLEEHRGDTGLVIVDARPPADYDRGHIPGAVNLDPTMPEGLRKAATSPAPLQLEDDEVLAATLGRYGLAADDHIVVYSDQGRLAGFLLSVLDYAGAENIALLDGGLAAWRDSGHELTAEPTDHEEKTFTARPRPEVLVDNDFVKAHLDNSEVVTVDIRSLHHSLGFQAHGRAARPGRVPGSVLLPLAALYEDGGGIRPADELLWLLRERNIPPRKTIIVTGSTGLEAGAARFVFRYLGYPDVRVHDASWVGWRD